MTLRVLICDDHSAVRSGLAAAMRLEPDLDVVGEAGDGADALSRATALHPDVVVIDYKMPACSGSEATARILAASPATRVLLLTGYDDPHLLRTALRAGATGFVLKSTGVAELLGAVRSVGRGDTYIDSRMVRHLVGGIADARTSTDSKPLSEREYEVLRLTSKGLAMKEISAQMNLRTRTIERYKSRGMGKLGLSTRAELMAYAIANEWLAHL